MLSKCLAIPPPHRSRNIFEANINLINWNSYLFINKIKYRLCNFRRIYRTYWLYFYKTTRAFIFEIHLWIIIYFCHHKSLGFVCQWWNQYCNFIKKFFFVFYFCWSCNINERHNYGAKYSFCVLLWRFIVLFFKTLFLDDK